MGLGMIKPSHDDDDDDDEVTSAYRLSRHGCEGINHPGFQC